MICFVVAGQEKFHALGPIYYRDSKVALLVYDITDRESFVRVQNWVRELRKIVGMKRMRETAEQSRSGKLIKSISVPSFLSSFHFIFIVLVLVFFYFGSDASEQRKEKGERSHSCNNKEKKAKDVDFSHMSDNSKT